MAMMAPMSLRPGAPAGYAFQSQPGLPYAAGFSQPVNVPMPMQHMQPPMGMMPAQSMPAQGQIMRSASLSAPVSQQPMAMPLQPMPTQMLPVGQPNFAQPVPTAMGAVPTAVPTVARTPSLLPPGATSSAAPPPAGINMGNDVQFKMGDKVQLRGQAGNPAYEGKVYTVEALDPASGAVQVAFPLNETAVSRMTFNRAFLELVTSVDDLPQDEVSVGVPSAAQQLQQVHQMQQDDLGDFRCGDKVRIAGLDACPRHNGRLCAVEVVDDLKKVIRVKFLEGGGNDMLELDPKYLELVEPVQEAPAVQLPKGVSQDPGLDAGVGSMVRILAPPQHRGKVAKIENAQQGNGSMRVRLQEPSDSVTMLVVSPTHVENLDGSPVAGTAEAQAASAAAADALRQAALDPPAATLQALPPLAVQPGDRVRVKPSMAAHAGKVGMIEAADDGAGSAVVRLEDTRGGSTVLRINPIHLDPA